MMLEFLGWNHEAAALREAVRASLRENKFTPGLGGEMKTAELGDWLARFVKQRAQN